MLHRFAEVPERGAQEHACTTLSRSMTSALHCRNFRDKCLPAKAAENLAGKVLLSRNYTTLDITDKPGPDALQWFADLARPGAA